MTISSDLTSTALAKPAALPPEAAEAPAVADRDGDADDRGAQISLQPYQGTKINLTV